MIQTGLISNEKCVDYYIDERTNLLKASSYKTRGTPAKGLSKTKHHKDIDLIITRSINRRVRKLVVKDENGQFQDSFLQQNLNCTFEEYCNLRSEFETGMTAKTDDFVYIRNFLGERIQRPKIENMNSVSQICYSHNRESEKKYFDDSRRK